MYLYNCKLSLGIELKNVSCGSLESLTHSKVIKTNKSDDKEQDGSNAPNHHAAVNALGGLDFFGEMNGLLGFAIHFAKKLKSGEMAPNFGIPKGIESHLFHEHASCKADFYGSRASDPEKGRIYCWNHR